MTEEPDYYAALGLSPAADETAIRAAYRHLARRYHPDVAGPSGLPRMRALNAAYAVLGDPTQRAAYDQRHGFASAPSLSTPRPTPAPTAPRSGTLRASAGPLQRIVTLDAPPMPIAALALAGQTGILALGLLDGHVSLRAIASGQTLATLDFGPQAGAGVLQEIRLSPSGRLAAAWGFSLGLRVWDASTRASLWNTALSAPSDLLDLALAEAPPFVALATPDAPLALATDDPFRWAHEGRGGSAIYYRPLSGPIAPNWANPLHCAAAGAGGLFGPARAEGWRVRARLLAASGRALLTFAQSERGEVQLAQWDLMRRGLRGGIAPRQEVRHTESARLLRLPLAATPDLACVALVLGEGALRLLSVRDGRSSTLIVGELPEEPRLALSTDGAWLALGRDDRVELWNATTGQHAQEWRFGAEVTALAFGAGGGRALLAVGLANGLAEGWG